MHTRCQTRTVTHTLMHTRKAKRCAVRTAILAVLVRVVVVCVRTVVVRVAQRLEHLVKRKGARGKKWESRSAGRAGRRVILLSARVMHTSCTRSAQRHTHATQRYAHAPPHENGTPKSASTLRLGHIREHI